MKIYILIFLCTLSFNSLAQTNKKDTLYIKYDQLLLSKEQIKGEKGFIYKIKGTGNNGYAYLLEQEKYNNLKPKKVKCFKRILKKSNAYYKSDKLKGKLDDWKIAEYLGQYILFLVNNDKEIIKIEAWYEID